MTIPKGPRKYDSGAEMRAYEKERDEAAEEYVKLKHAKEQRHFESPDKWGPLPPILEQEGYMFKAGADWARARALGEIEMHARVADQSARELLTERATSARLRQALELVVTQFEDMQGSSNIREEWHRVARQALTPTAEDK